VRASDPRAAACLALALVLAAGAVTARAENQAGGLSPIFDWFDEDFAAAGGVLAFVSRYLSPERRARLEAVDDPDVEYLDYDWSLNAVEG